MKIQQHYLMNLKRRPDRLHAWLGAQRQMRFNFGKLTVFEAIDGTSFASTGEMAVFASEILSKYGFDYFLNHRNIKNVEQRNFWGNIIGKLYLLGHILSEHDGYAMLWEDDIVLQRPYNELISAEIPDDANIIAFHYPAKKPKNRVIQETRHAELDYYRGCVSRGANQALCLNAKGAETILELYKSNASTLELEGFFLANPSIQGMYTSMKNFAHFCHVTNPFSDVFEHMNKNQFVLKHLRINP